MQALAFALQTFVLSYLVLAQPVVGRYMYARLTLTGERPRFYRTMIALEWFRVALVLGSLWLDRQPLSRLGLAAYEHLPAVAGTLAGLLLVMGLVTRFWPAVRAHYARRMGRLEAMLPRTGRERVLFGALAVSAGICEEILFRSFLIWYVGALVPGLPAWALIAVSAVVFGVAHAYQGMNGVIATGLLGAFFAFLYLQVGSLLPVMALHAFVDLQALVVSWAAAGAGERKAA